MKKIILATAIAVTFGSSYVLAHHPASDIVDPEIYDRIDENVSESHVENLDTNDMGDMTGSADPDDDVGNNSRAAQDVEVGQGGSGPGNQN